MAVWGISQNASQSYVKGEMSADKVKGGTANAGNNTSASANMELMAYGAQRDVVVGSVLVSGNPGNLNGISPANLSLAFDQGDGIGFKQPRHHDRFSRADITYVYDGAAQDKSVRRIIKNHAYLVKQAVKNNKWNEFSGSWATGFPQVRNSGLWSVTSNVDRSTNGLLVDDEAGPSRSSQGEFTFRYGSPTASGADYKARTG